MKYEEPLDPEQLAAVEAEERAIAVLAGPGSGKTRVLSYRARFLLLKDKKANCLLLTFTNKAASEMKARAIKANPVMSKRIRAGTFHNFALSVLRSHGTHVGLQQDFDVIDDEERRNFTAKGASASGGKDLYSDWSASRLRMALAPAPVAKFGAAYEAAKRDANVVDFDDLIVLTVNLFRQKPDVAKAYATNYSHILIDEFQDTNAAQFAIVKALAEHASPTSTIGVFADDDQAIFGFAGAEAKNIGRFCDDLTAKTYPLTTNYRCAETIVTVANNLIQANRAKGREMKSNKKGGEVSVQVYEGVDDEAAAICNEIAGEIAKGTSAEKISILVRSAARASAIKDALVTNNIPFSNWLAASYNAYETRLVRVCLATVRPVLSNRACAHLCEVLGIQEIPTASKVDTQVFLEKFRNVDGVKHLLAIRKLIDEGAKVSKVVEQVCACVEAVDPENISVGSLVAEVEAFEAHDPEYSLEHFLSDLALGGKGGAPTEGGGVKIATIHRTKGLQWPHVYLVGLDEGNLPNYHAVNTEEGVREERRLCFVGVCRAEDALTITRIKLQKGHTKLPSRFIAEMGL